MRKFITAGLVVGALFASASGAQAHPLDQHDPYGRLCSFLSTTDPQVEGSQTGEINGGPLVIEEEETVEVEAGTMTCTIQVNASTHAGADSCSVEGTASPAVVTAGGTCTYSSDDDDNVYLCTQVDIDGHATLYYNSSNDPLVSGSWSTDPNSSCSLAISASTPGEEETPWKEIHDIELLIDSIICPILALVFPPDGDIANVWDCPPYSV